MTTTLRCSLHSPMLEVPDLLHRDEVLAVRDLLARADWQDGRGPVGRPLQLPARSPVLEPLRLVVLGALKRSVVFQSAVLPAHISPPAFSRFEVGMGCGAHIEPAMRVDAVSGQRLRTDVSVTVLLSDPDSYDGGELLLDALSGLHEVKLAAGAALVSPATCAPLVRPVTRGLREACCFQVQSLVADDAERSLLFELDASIMSVHQHLPNSDAALRLTGVYHQLLRRWGHP